MEKHDYPVSVAAYEWEQYDGDAPPTELVKFIAWAQKMLNSIPAEYRDTARIELDSRTSYDQSLATLEISYKRPATEADIAERREKSAEAVRRELEWAKNRVAEQERRLADLQNTKP